MYAGFRNPNKTDSIEYTTHFYNFEDTITFGIYRESIINQNDTRLVRAVPRIIPISYEQQS